MEEELSPIIKIDKEEKVIEGRGSGRMRKYQNEKRKSEMVPKLGPKTQSNKGAQTKKKDQIRCEMLQRALQIQNNIMPRTTC